MVFRNCVPLDIHAISIQDILKPLCEQVAKENGVRYWSLIDFAKGKGQLAFALERELATGKYNGEAIMCNGYSDEINAVENVLIASAKFVVVGSK
jgi:hypothetical protein